MHYRQAHSKRLAESIAELCDLHPLEVAAAHEFEERVNAQLASSEKVSENLNDNSTSALSRESLENKDSSQDKERG